MQPCKERQRMGPAIHSKHCSLLPDLGSLDPTGPSNQAALKTAARSHGGLRWQWSCAVARVPQIETSWEAIVQDLMLKVPAIQTATEWLRSKYRGSVLKSYCFVLNKEQRSFLEIAIRKSRIYIQEIMHGKGNPLVSFKILSIPAVSELCGNDRPAWRQGFAY